MRRQEREPKKGEKLWRAMSLEVRAADDARRIITHVITSRTVDRYGDVVEPRGGRLENFKKNPVVLFGHNDWKFPIGRNLALEVSDIEIVAQTEFAGLEQNHNDAETAYRLARDGFLKAWSIGFMPITWSEDEALPGQDGWWFKEWELYEYSLVPIPANPDCVLALSKAFSLPVGATEKDLEDALRVGPRQKYFDVAAALVKKQDAPTEDRLALLADRFALLLDRQDAAVTRMETCAEEMESMAVDDAAKGAPGAMSPESIRAAFRAFGMKEPAPAR